jgi:hypothetical protein
MGKIGCNCGNIIVDQSNNLSYKGAIIPDISQDDIFDMLNELTSTLAEAISNNQKEEWMKAHGLTSPYPADVTESSLINNLFFNYYFNKVKDIFQCENCGRILIQKAKSSHYIFFKPDSEDWKDILNKID